MIIRPATGEADLAEIRRLFREYAEWLGVDLSFQNFDQELAGLPGDYSPPGGRLWIAEQESRAGAAHVCGCVALRPLEQDICEMKRLYVRSDCRGSGLGRRLVEEAMQEARQIGYKRMRLDTLPQMSAAQGLYESLGFRPIHPYGYNPIAGTKFLEAELASP